MILAAGPQTAPTGYPGNANSFPSTDDEQIFSVSFGSMTNAQTETCTTNYTNYTATIPAVIGFLLVQKSLIRGLAAGGVNE